MAPTLERTTFEISRAAEYFSSRELQAMTGQPEKNFAAVVLKELADNGLDAAESAGISPEIGIAARENGEFLHLTVSDNGPGIPPETVERILNFQTRTSDKAAYRSPTRGAQGNALKTVLGIPYALGCDSPVVINSRGIRHSIGARTDPAGELRIDHQTASCVDRVGTEVSVTLPFTVKMDPRSEFYVTQTKLDPTTWARAFALFNPHALIRISVLGDWFKPANNSASQAEETYQSTLDFPGSWRKFLPTDLTSPHWYDSAAMKHLIFSHVAHARNTGEDILLRDFVRQFRGMSSTVKAKEVCSKFPKIKHLSDFDDDEVAADKLWIEMRCATSPPSANVLGAIGENHFKRCIGAWYGLKRWWYKRISRVEGGIPWICEVGVAEVERGEFELFTGLNFSPSFDDPLAGTVLGGPDGSTQGIRSFLSSAYVSDIPSVTVFHLTSPRLRFLDRGKTRVEVD